MFKSLGVLCGIAACAAGFAAPTLAQDFGAHQSVIEQCALVAAEEQRSYTTLDHALRGLCIRATADYLTTLAGAGLSPEEFGTELAALVVDLTNLLHERTCLPESEIAQAIRLASAASEDPEQEAQILLISQTVSTCDFGATAALPGDPIEFFDADLDDPIVFQSLVGGEPASFS